MSEEWVAIVRTGVWAVPRTTRSLEESPRVLVRIFAIAPRREEGERQVSDVRIELKIPVSFQVVRTTRSLQESTRVLVRILAIAPPREEGERQV